MMIEFVWPTGDGNVRRISADAPWSSFPKSWRKVQIGENIHANKHSLGKPEMLIYRADRSFISEILNEMQDMIIIKIGAEIIVVSRWF